MLYVLSGSINPKTAPREFVGRIDTWFDLMCEDDWLDNDWARRVVKEVDKSELLSPKSVDSPILGMINHTWLSGGAKQLIMMNAAPEAVFNGDCMGDNCWPLLLELSKTKDIRMSLFYFPTFKWVDGAKIKIINTGEIVDNGRDFDIARLRLNNCIYYEFKDIEWPGGVEKGCLDKFM